MGDNSTDRGALRAAAAIVAFGIADFVAAPGATVALTAAGAAPEEMGRLPLAAVPLLLVPQVLVLEVLAVRQLWVLKQALIDGAAAQQAARKHA